MSATMPWARSERLRLKTAIVKNQAQQVTLYEKADTEEARLVRTMRGAVVSHATARLGLTSCVLCAYRFAGRSGDGTPQGSR